MPSVLQIHSLLVNLKHKSRHYSIGMEKQDHSRNQLSRSLWAFHKHEFNGWSSLALYQVVWLAVCLIQMDAFEMEVLAMKSSVRHLQQVLALSFKIYIVS